MKLILLDAIVVLTLCLIFIYLHWNWYDSLKDKYEAGNYEEVYGYVEDFKAGEKYGSGRGADDIFYVGGVITGNGRHLHIEYINMYVGNIVERYIVYIAEIEEEGNQ